MTDKKKYKKICKKYRKELKKIAKDTYPWDYCFMLNYFEVCLKFMKEYYELGYNVWADEQCHTWDEAKHLPTRLESVTKALSEYEAYYAMDDKYYKLCKNSVDSDLAADTHIEYLIQDRQKNKEAYLKESKQHWDNFWDTVKNNIQSWWD